MATQLIVNNEQVWEPIWEPKKRYTCACGLNTTLGNRFRHNKTLKHQTYLQQGILRANGTLVEEEPAIIDAKKDYHRQYMRGYYELNKDRINKTIHCRCGLFTTLNNKSRHDKTIPHQELIVRLDQIKQLYSNELTYYNILI